jgi:hypothetical protein
LGLLIALAAVAGGERTAAAQSTIAAAKADPGVVVGQTTSIKAKPDAVDVASRRHGQWRRSSGQQDHRETRPGAHRGLAPPRR